MESLSNLLEERLRYSFVGSKMGGVGQLTILFCYLDSSEKEDFFISMVTVAQYERKHQRCCCKTT